MKVKRLIAVLVAVIVLASSFVAVLGDEDDDKNQIYRPAVARTGTYNGYTYNLDTISSSSTFLWAKGEYAINAWLKLRMFPTVRYTNSSNTYSYYTVSTTNYSLGGNAYNSDEITKSYTVSQAASYFTLNIDGTPVPLNYVLGSDACFTKCNYKLLIGGTEVCSLTRSY